jgi:hypothetical protein
MTTLGPEIDDVRSIVGFLQSRTRAETDAGRNSALTRSAPRPGSEKPRLSRGCP